LDHSGAHFFFSSRRRHTRFSRDWSSDVCSSDLQASPPSMRIPIAYGIAWPDRVASAAPAIDWTRAHQWTFEPLDHEAFPAVRLACEVGTAGGTAPAVYNAANEEAVAAFLAGRLAFPAILDTVAPVVSEHRQEVLGGTPRLEDVYEADGWARKRAGELISRQG